MKLRMQIPSNSLKHFQSIARRLYRIFAHTYFHHRAVFDEFEEQYALYERFTQFSKKYDLIPDNLIIIPSATSTPTTIKNEN